MRRCFDALASDRQRQQLMMNAAAAAAPNGLPNRRTQNPTVVNVALRMPTKMNVQICELNKVAEMFELVLDPVQLDKTPKCCQKRAPQGRVGDWKRFSVTVVQVGDKLGLTRNKWPAQKTRAQMRALICAQIAGKVAEERAFETSLYHGVDQQNWLRTARALVRASRADRELAPELQEAHLAAAMDTVIAQAHDRVRRILMANEKKLRQMAQLLFRKSSFNADEFRREDGIDHTRQLWELLACY
uniref:Uncharacterized protein n=1 Tax=Globodera rostochiensis TaxID=31243 RepID=A0A914HCR4_GLORO